MDRFFRWLVAASLPYRRSVYRAGGFGAVFESFEQFYRRSEIEAAEQAALQAREDIERAGLCAVCLEDPRYPRPLREIFDPPPILFASGMLPDCELIAVVGTRRPSALSLAAARAVVSRMPQNAGLVSGFARGIDFEAHRAASRRGLANVAVLGSGILFPTPDTSLVLLERETPPVLVSEFLPRTRALRYNFPRRNRIIAGLARQILLLQAPEKSGALITARYGLEEGRDLFVFDHPLFSDPQNAGGRGLLYDGAELLVVPEIERRIVQKPPGTWPPGPLQLEFFRKKQSGLSWLCDDYYIEE